MTDIPPPLLGALRVAIGNANVLTSPEGIESYGRDEAGRLFARTPDVVVRPRDAAQVAKILALAQEYRVAVTARGAGSGLAGAAVPLAGGIVLSVERMNRILEIDAVNRVAVVEPGVITNDLCRAVMRKGFLYAGYPMSTETSTIGGNIATNAGGAKVLRYGSTRRSVLGVDLAVPGGEILTLGGRYRKETWGYSLLQLVVGSEGTLGVVTRATLALEPLERAATTILAAFRTTDEAVAAVVPLLASGAKLTACEYMDRMSVRLSTDRLNTTLPMQDDAEAYLVLLVEDRNESRMEEEVELTGTLLAKAGALEVFVADNRTQAERIWSVRQGVTEGILAVDPWASMSGDTVVPLSAVGEMIRLTDAICARRGVRVCTIGHVADGNMHPAFFKPEASSPKSWATEAEDLYAEIVAAAVRLGGVGSGEHGVGYVKAPMFAASKSKRELAVMAGVRAAFDPDGIMNPGKLAI
jgi:glycolate oxidase